MHFFASHRESWSFFDPPPGIDFSAQKTVFNFLKILLAES